MYYDLSIYSYHTSYLNSYLIELNIDITLDTLIPYCTRLIIYL